MAQNLNYHSQFCESGIWAEDPAGQFFCPLCCCLGSLAAVQLVAGLESLRRLLSYAWCLDRKIWKPGLSWIPLPLHGVPGPFHVVLLQAGGTSSLAAQPSKRPEWKLQYSQSLDLGVAVVPSRTRLWEQPQGSPDSRRGEGDCASQ